MNITVGRGYGGRRPNTAKPAFNKLVCDEVGLTNELEMRAGIVHQPTSKAQRTITYMAALQAADNPGRFYHRSLTVDPVACAKELLSWRDSAILHGWRVSEHVLFPHDHGETKSSEGRLKDLEDVEDFLQDFSPCLAERIIRLFDHLEPICRAVNRIEVHSSALVWPKLLKRLFAEINRFQSSYAEHNGINKQSCRELMVLVRYETEWLLPDWPYKESKALVPEWQEDSKGRRICIYTREDGVDEVVVRPKTVADSSSDLGRLQKALLSQSLEEKVVQNDGSLCFYSAINHQVAADYLCAEVTQAPNHIVIARDKQQLLNNALVWHSFPEPGIGEASQWRAPLQLLPSLIALCWKTPAAEAVLSYLTLPAGPHRKLRRQLARLFSDLPGLNTQAWKKATDEYVEKTVSAFPDKNAPELLESVDSWLPVAAGDSNENIPCDIIVSLCQQVAKYWSGLAAHTTDQGKADLYHAASTAARATQESVEAWDETIISRVQLERVLNLVADESTTAAHGTRQVSPVNIVDLPEAMGDFEFDHLLYWGVNLADSSRLPQLTNDELSCLPYAPGMDEQGEESRAILNNALMPFMKAKESAVLIQLDENTNLLKVLLDNVLNNRQWPAIETSLLSGNSRAPLAKVADHPFPQTQRWWHLPEGIIPQREKQSYSSLSTLIERPHEYVLRYGAKISEGSISSVPVDHRLLGNLGHRIIEAWFEKQPWIPGNDYCSEAEIWLEKELDNLAMQYALPLLAPGKRSEKLYFRDAMLHALKQLLTHLKSANAVAVEVEKKMETGERFGLLEGSLDLLVHLPDSNLGIVDIKWGGEKGRQEDLANSRYLQLATYHHLATETGNVLGVAYFILSSGKMLATDRLVFPNPVFVDPGDTAIPPGGLWQKFNNTLDWRLEQLDQGRVEVTYTSADSDENSIAPGSALDMTAEESRVLDIRKKSNGYKQTFKRIDTWRVLTGQGGE